MRMDLSLVAACVVALAAQVQLSDAGGSKTDGSGVAGLPHSRGKNFATLDAYLAHRKTLGGMDLPYYRALPDGRYELMTGRAQKGRQGQIFTRRQLLEMFGFDR